MQVKYFSYKRFQDSETLYIPKIFGSVDESLAVDYFGDSLIKVSADNLTYIEDFIYAQNPNCDITEISEIDFKSLVKDTPQMLMKKKIVRNNIRNLKDIEDDLVDQKILVQSLLVGLSEIYKVLTIEQKAIINNKFNLENLSTTIDSNFDNMRINIEKEKRVDSILKDEGIYNDILKIGYLNEIRV